MILILLCMVLASFESVNSANLNSRMLGGKEAPLGSLPFLAFIRCNNEYLGVGTVISDKCVLTSHTVLNRIKDKDCVIGVGSNKLSTGATTYKIHSLILHPNPKPFDYTYKVALLKVSGFTFTDKVKPIQLATKYPAEGTQLTVAGWGETSTVTNADFSDSYRYMNITTSSQSDCRDFIGYDLGNRAFCSKTNGAQALCWGDHGAPVFLNKELVGVTAFIDEPCNVTIPVGFNSMFYFRNWISENCDLECV